MLSNKRILEIIHSQGYGESIIFKMKDVAALLDQTETEVIGLIEEKKLRVKQFSRDPVGWRVTTTALLEFFANNQPLEAK